MSSLWAVSTKQLTKVFDDKEVIHACNMTVEQGMISLWFGFKKKSVIVTIFAACIIVVMTLFSSPLLIAALIVMFIGAVLVRKSLHRQVENIGV